MKVFLVLLLLGATHPARAAVSAPEARKPASDFALKNATGSSVRLSDFKGRVVLLNFWATWCHGCKQELPWFVDFEKSYKGRGLEVIAASTDKDGWKAVKPYLKKRPLNFPVVLATETLTAAYGLAAMPMTVLIDRRGRVAATYVGLVDRKACNQDLQALLREDGARP